MVLYQSTEIQLISSFRETAEAVCIITKQVLSYFLQLWYPTFDVWEASVSSLLFS